MPNQQALFMQRVCDISTYNRLSG